MQQILDRSFVVEIASQLSSVQSIDEVFFTATGNPAANSSIVYIGYITTLGIDGQLRIRDMSGAERILRIAGRTDPAITVLSFFTEIIDTNYSCFLGYKITFVPEP